MPDSHLLFALTLGCCLSAAPSAIAKEKPPSTDGPAARAGEAKAAEQARKECDAGTATGCVNLGIAYTTGKGVTRDDKKALELFDKACKAGVAGGCFNLATAWYEGRGVTADPARARGLYQQACDGKYPKACSNLGILFESGVGGPKDEARAAEMFRKGCDGGEPVSCYNLATRYNRGLGVPVDRARAATLFQGACDAVGQVLSVQFHRPGPIYRQRVHLTRLNPVPGNLRDDRIGSVSCRSHVRGVVEVYQELVGIRVGIDQPSARQYPI